jgi:nicotinate phosphoribosyltransferase
MSATVDLHVSAERFKLDINGLRRGYYSDKYFENIAHVLEAARNAGYTFSGASPRDLPRSPDGLSIGDIEVEAQVFNRRSPTALVAGIGMTLAMLRHVTGYYEGGTFRETWKDLEVEAVDEGVFTTYEGNTEDVEPVLKIRGRYRDFAQLETPILGVLTRASRIATNVYQTLQAARGKTVFFMPARFDLPEVQPIDGYAYWLAVQRYNQDSGHQVPVIVSTDAQAAWWGGLGSGTVPHALIACFLADTAEAMRVFAEYMPTDVLRVALADFNNDSVDASLQTLAVYWPYYLAACQSGDLEAQKRWTLNGVRLDTSSTMRDVSMEPDGERGTNPALVRKVRQAIDHAWESWNVPAEWVDTAKQFCRNVKIVVSGGFNAAKIDRFEREGTPVDLYGVGSTLLRNGEDSNTDYTMDVVRVKLWDAWVDIAKLGRLPNDNPNLKPVDLSRF